MKFFVQKVYSICQPGKRLADGTTLNYVVCICSVIKIFFQELLECFWKSKNFFNILYYIKGLTRLKEFTIILQ